MSRIMKLLSAAAGVLAGTHLPAAEVVLTETGGDGSRIEACRASAVAAPAPRCVSPGLRIARA